MDLAQYHEFHSIEVFGYQALSFLVCVFSHWMHALHAQWLVLRTILHSGDVETNPGPETLNFCTWNLNSITVYDFLMVSLIEAYNAVTQ